MDDASQSLRTTVNNGGTANRLTAVVKEGLGTHTFDGALNYSGGTTVSNGVLAIAGTTVIPNTSPIITLVAPGTLDVSGAGGVLTIGGAAPQAIRGTGRLQGALVMAPNGTNSPGFGIGTLTVSSSITLYGTSVMEVNGTNSQNSDLLVAQSGTLTYGGVLNVNNIGSLALTNGTYTFQLFSAPTITGSFTATNLPPLGGPNRTWDTSELAQGRIKLVVAVDSTPVTLTNTVTGGNTLQLTWPTGSIGWRLQVQSNTVAAPNLRTNWVTISGSDATNLMSFPIGTTNGSVYYRMIFP